MADFWAKLMSNDENTAAHYMETYGEGIGSDTRMILGSFINDKETVLDVGCGPGWNYAHFMKYGPNVRNYKGLDYSPMFVKVAKERNPEADYQLGDCRKLEEADKSWDVVILQDVLEHTNGFEKPVLEALRVAKKRIIITFWHLKDMDDPHINDDGDDGWGAWYDKREWEKFLDTLDYHWLMTETPPTANRQHLFYILDKKEPHG
jgi:SAM-dependent methyltransferase